MSYFKNPLTEYLNWFFRKKVYYQFKYRHKHLVLEYLASPKNVVFGFYNWIGANTILENTTIDDFTYFSENSVILETKFGKFCSIGSNVKTAPGKHPTKIFVSTHPSIYSNPKNLKKNFATEDKHNPTREVIVGNDVWIGSNAIIADGVTIGDGAIIGGNSLVNRDVPPYSIVIGVPAEIVRYRFEQDEIAFLLKFKWWNKDIQWIETNSHYLCNIKQMVEKFGR
jgi:chloramphenicol O-acetyltransferase type B